MLALLWSLFDAIFLLMRKQLAKPVFLISLFCVVLTSIHNHGFARAADFDRAAGAFFSILIFVVALILVVYARYMAKKNVLV
jgi:cobalamin biosynthesis protein CobD/CbiB